MSLDKLIGKKFVKFSVDKGKTTFTAYQEDKELIYEAYGDCCSRSWIEHMDDSPTDCIVTNVIEKPVNMMEIPGYDCLQQYFYEIVTDKGSFTLEMRNESNGYYGGSMEFVGEKPI